LLEPGPDLIAERDCSEQNYYRYRGDDQPVFDDILTAFVAKEAHDSVPHGATVLPVLQTSTKTRGRCYAVVQQTSGWRLSLRQ
jgi:hypothetical protein